MLHQLFKKIIHSGIGRGKYIGGMLVLGIAFLLILLSLQVYIDYNDLLQGKYNKSQAEDFLVLSKEISNVMMSDKNKGLFSDAEIAELQKNKMISSVAPVISNRFRATAEGFTTSLPFYSDIFFQSVPDAFIDVSPKDWEWKEGANDLPVIIPNAWLDLYNTGMAFTRSDLPPLSAETVKALPIKVNLFNSNNQTLTFMGHVSGFSDRLNSIMVPASFMDWANKNFGYAAMNGYTAVVIKTNDPSNPLLTDALQKSNYRFDKEKTRFSQYREMVNKVVPTIGIFGLLMLLFGLLVFSLFIQLTISNSQQDIQLLTTLGAAPKQLERFLMKRFFPINVIIIIASILLISAGQFVLQNVLAKQNAFISPFVSYLLPIAGLLLLAVVYFVLRKNMRTYIYQQAR